MATSKLINVRLSPADAAKAKDLQKSGMKLSELLRQGIRSEHERLTRAQRRPRYRSAAELLRKIIEDTPIPASAHPPPIDLTDRKAVRARIRESILAKRSLNDPRRHQRPRRSA